MSALRLKRRTLLRGLGAGAGALALPFTRRGRAQNTAPKRLLVVYTPNGTISEHWHFNAGGILEPLAAHRAKLTQITGIDDNASNNSPGGGHQAGMGALLTGTTLQEGDDANSGRFPSGWPTGPSIDHTVAGLINESRYEAIRLGVGVTSNGVLGRLSYRGIDQPIAPENDPRAVYSRIFADLGAEVEGSGPSPLLARNQSILDHLSGEIADLQRAAGAEDRRMLDAHLTALRATENNLMPTLPPTLGCTAPAAPSIATPLDPAVYPQVSRAQIDLLATAFSCGLTQVGTLHYGGFDISHPWIGVEEQHHNISHGTGETARDIQRQILRWYSGELAYLLDRLDSVEDVDGNTLLDNTYVLCVSEVSDPQSHSRKNMQLLTAGSGGGYFRTGGAIHVGEASGPVSRTQVDNHNDFWLTLLRWAGSDAPVFGRPELCGDPMSAMVV